MGLVSATRTIDSRWILAVEVAEKHATFAVYDTHRKSCEHEGFRILAVRSIIGTFPPETYPILRKKRQGIQWKNRFGGGHPEELHVYRHRLSGQREHSNFRFVGVVMCRLRAESDLTMAKNSEEVIKLARTVKYRVAEVNKIHLVTFAPNFLAGTIIWILRMIQECNWWHLCHFKHGPSLWLVTFRENDDGFGLDSRKIYRGDSKYDAIDCSTTALETVTDYFFGSMPCTFSWIDHLLG